MRGQRRATRAVLPPKITRGQGGHSNYGQEKRDRAALLAKMIARAERGEPLFAERRES